MSTDQHDVGSGNFDLRTVESFSDEWSKFDQSRLSPDEHQRMFDAYFDIFPWKNLPHNAEGFDMGCGTGRWAKLVAPRVGILNCIEPSKGAFEAAEKNLASQSNVRLHRASTDTASVENASQDFGYCLGVLHHIPDTQSALNSCTKLLKIGAPMLIYMYYNFENRPLIYRYIWKTSNMARLMISIMPRRIKSSATDAIALSVYLPLSRLCLAGESLGINMSNFPLYNYRRSSIYTLRTDSRDRFGTPLEKRYTRKQIKTMMEKAGLRDIVFSEQEPFWHAVGIKS